MTNPDRLGASVDRVVAIIRELLPPKKAPLADALGVALGDLFAELIGRATVQSASIIAPTLRKVEDLEARERRRSERVEELQRTVNGQVDALWAGQMPHDERARHVGKIYELESRVAELEQQVGDDASNAAGQ